MEDRKQCPVRNDCRFGLECNFFKFQAFSSTTRLLVLLSVLLTKRVKSEPSGPPGRGLSQVSVT